MLSEFPRPGGSECVGQFGALKENDTLRIGTIDGQPLLGVYRADVYQPSAGEGHRDLCDRRYFINTGIDIPGSDHVVGELTLGEASERILADHITDDGLEVEVALTGLKFGYMPVRIKRLVPTTKRQAIEGDLTAAVAVISTDGLSTFSRVELVDPDQLGFVHRMALEHREYMYGSDLLVEKLTGYAITGY